MNDFSKSNKYAEILAPAGNYECFRAALNAGADAVYLGGSMFGARAFAGNFNEEELLEAIRTAHLYGKKVYLTVNTLLRGDELEELADYIRPYYEAGLDAAIVQDYGVFAVLHRHFPELALHASTQMTITGRYGAQLLKNMGATRVVTARELSAAEIKNIHEHVDIEIESFVHGALCYSYSGQCLLSSMLGGRSGNRGRCAQPCRLTYSMNGIKNKHLLSPKDMCTIEAIPDIIDAGVYSLKIEGRMKGPEYVAGVVSTYRKYLDMYLDEGRDGYRVDRKDIQMLMDLYNRGGFCKGYYYKNNDKDMMTFNRPNHQGIAVGEIRNGSIVLTEPVNARDVLELGNGVEYTIAAPQKAGSSILIPKSMLKAAKNNTIVYRTRNNELLERIRSSYIEKDIKLPVRMSVYLKAGEEASLTVSLKDSPDGMSWTACGDVLEASENHPATKEDVLKQLRKLGATRYCCDEKDISVELSGQPFVPVKLLNELRRNALKLLEDGILSQSIRNGENHAVIENDGTENATEQEALAEGDCRLHCYDDGAAPETEQQAQGFTVQVMTKEQLEAVLEVSSQDNGCNISRVYISTELEGLDGALAMCRMVRAHNNMLNTSGKSHTVQVYLAMPYIFREKTAGLYDRKKDDIKAAGFDGIMVRNPDEIGFIKEKGLDSFGSGGIIADYNVYTYNSEAFRQYERLGINSFTLSEELNSRQLKSLCAATKQEKLHLEKLVYGYLPLMVTAGCTLKYTSKDKPCGRPGVYYLTDRMNKAMPVINSCHYCYNLIYNSVPENLLDRVGELKSMGVNAMRMAFTIETKDMTRRILEEMKGYSEYTRGHYNRGVD